MWTHDTGDANGDSSSSARRVLDQVINSYPKPANILSHSTVQHSEYMPAHLTEGRACRPFRTSERRLSASRA